MENYGIMEKKNYGNMDKKLWYYTGNLGILTYNGKNYGIVKKIWYYSKL